MRSLRGTGQGATLSHCLALNCYYIKLTTGRSSGLQERSRWF